MPASRRSSSKRPPAPLRAAPSLMPNKIAAQNIAFGFAATYLMFVTFILVILMIYATSQIPLFGGRQPLVPVLTFDAGGCGALLLLIWVIKGYTEARWYSIGIGLLIYVALAGFLYTISRAYSLLPFLGIVATLLGVGIRVLSWHKNEARHA